MIAQEQTYNSPGAARVGYDSGTTDIHYCRGSSSDSNPVNEIICTSIKFRFDLLNYIPHTIQHSRSSTPILSGTYIPIP